MIHQLRITLLETNPPVCRTIEVAADTDLRTFHSIIQAAMGWENHHLYEFQFGEATYGEAEEEALSWQPDLKRAEEARLGQLLREPGDRITYVYDLGDSWEHEVRLEKILQPAPRVAYPRCIAAERACPPEDCGGVYGYEMLLDVLSDPEHPDPDELREWIGGDFDPDEVHLDIINQELELI